MGSFDPLPGHTLHRNVVAIGHLDYGLMCDYISPIDRVHTLTLADIENLYSYYARLFDCFPANFYPWILLYLLGPIAFPFMHSLPLYVPTLIVPVRSY